jgi:hypothetical protein
MRRPRRAAAAAATQLWLDACLTPGGGDYAVARAPAARAE